MKPGHISHNNIHFFFLTYFLIVCVLMYKKLHAMSEPYYITDEIVSQYGFSFKHSFFLEKAIFGS